MQTMTENMPHCEW